MTDLTTQILIEIRDEIRTTRGDLSDRIDQTNTRLDRLEKRQFEGEIRVSTEIVALTGVVRDLRDTLLEDRVLRQTVDNHEQRIRVLETRT